ncbi:MAG: zinc metallopeptidase [Sandaracinaceae bacterium]|nr:zinc metallopeptidase [Sandaracinaceae bacterium]
MFYIDPLYLLLAAPGLILGLWAQLRVRSTFSRFSQIGTTRSLSGAEVAAEILYSKGIHDVRIEPTQGWLADHYDPRHKILRLSHDVYAGRSIAAAGVAAHEVGHAIQDAEDYAFLRMRSNLVPILSFASPLAVPIIVVGFIVSTMTAGPFGSWITLLGLGLFSLVVLFQLVTLPVEFDASRRALAAIERAGILQGQELAGARQVLSAAALTYVAAAVSAVLTLIYFLIRSGLLGGRRHD